MSIICNLSNKVIAIYEKEYKVVPRTDGRYYVSCDGDIYDTKLQRHIAVNKSKRGWIRCHIWQDGVRKTCPVHRVVMMAFVEESELTVNHKDGNKENNNINNLEYMTREEQNYHRSFILKVGNRIKIKCLENDKIYETIADACRDLGIIYKNSHISEIIKKKYGFKTSHGYHFEKV